MITLAGSIKKFIGFNKNKSREQKDNNTIPKKSDLISRLIDKVGGAIIMEFNHIKDKSKDLSNTNYRLGMKHLERGDIKEATFRFRVTKRFWPDNLQAYYQLAYCLTLEKKIDEARLVIYELLKKDSSYKIKTDALLNQDYKSILKNTKNNSLERE